MPKACNSSVRTIPIVGIISNRIEFMMCSRSQPSTAVWEVLGLKIKSQTALASSFAELSGIYPYSLPLRMWAFVSRAPFENLSPSSTSHLLHFTSNFNTVLLQSIWPQFCSYFLAFNTAGLPFATKRVVVVFKNRRRLYEVIEVHLKITHCQCCHSVKSFEVNC